MSYEIHVGDYIENSKGDVGWVTSVTDEKIVWETNNGKTYVMEVPTLNRVQHPEALFVRIGAYDFTKTEKKKIAPISDCNKHIVANAIKSDSHLVRTVIDDILNKINELVDAVNLLLDKSTES